MELSPFIAVLPPLAYLASARLFTAQRRLQGLAVAAVLASAVIATLQDRAWDPLIATALAPVIAVTLLVGAGRTFSKRSLYACFAVTASSPVWATLAPILAVLGIGLFVFATSASKAAIYERFCVAAWVVQVGTREVVEAVLSAPLDEDATLKKRIPLEPFVALTLVALAAWQVVR